MAGPFSRGLLPGLLAAAGTILAGSSTPAFEPHVFVVTRNSAGDVRQIDEEASIIESDKAGLTAKVQEILGS